MKTPGSDYSAVRLFFDYAVRERTSSLRKIGIPGAMVVAGLAALQRLDRPGGAVAAGVGVLVGGIILVLALDWAWSLGRRRRERRRLGRLAQKTRAVQARDAVKALLRIFQRSQLRLEDLRVLDERYQFKKERELFAQEKLEDQMGELFNKSVRMWSQGQSNKRFRRIVWDGGRVEDFLNPTRVVALYLTPVEMVICDIEMDSLDGNLKEGVIRIMLKDIVSIVFRSDRARFTMDTDAIVRLAEDMGLKPREIRGIRQQLGKRDQVEPDYLQEAVNVWLEITRTDGGSLAFPIRSEICFARRQARTGDIALTEDDRTIDRMMNELNRIVRSAKGEAAR